MFKLKKSIWLGAAMLGALLVGFQNCGKLAASRAGESSASSSSTDGVIHPIATQAATLAVFQSSSQISDAISLTVNTTYEIQLALDNLTASSVMWSAKSGVAGFANCSLVGTDLLKRSLMCSSVGTAHVEALVAFSDGTSQTKTFERTVANSGVVVPPGSIVTFSIQNGTARAAWNAPATPVVVFKGQTLHIVNNDVSVHRLHTSGSPCPHEPTNISTGQSYDCVIAAAHASTLNNMYDHNIGTGAAFYVNALDGSAKYTQKFNIGGVQKSCADCHGALANSAVKNASLATIKANISANSGGMGAITLTNDELNSIVYELSK